MSPADQNELTVLTNERERCHRNWVDGLSTVATNGRIHPTGRQYEGLERLLRSLRISQQRLETFERGLDRART
ncbi:MAG TPA: hypothetical protein VFL84_12610 [Gammaproteobacteria bacterium]|nr:hypothetical protein [Gammaproteobacteria bacterium]